MNVIVTRHKALARHLIEKGIAPADAVWIPHAGAQEVRGNRVFGALPLALAALASSVVDVRVDMRGLPRDHELTPEELASRVGPPREYRVISMTVDEPRPQLISETSREEACDTYHGTCW